MDIEKIKLLLHVPAVSPLVIQLSGSCISSKEPYPVTVGGWRRLVEPQAPNGSKDQFCRNNTITSTGGGGGGHSPSMASQLVENGGSGGGEEGNVHTVHLRYSRKYTSCTPPQGNRGGKCSNGSRWWYYAGGGGCIQAVGGHSRWFFRYWIWWRWSHTSSIGFTNY